MDFTFQPTWITTNSTWSVLICTYNKRGTFKYLSTSRCVDCGQYGHHAKKCNAPPNQRTASETSWYRRKTRFVTTNVYCQSFKTRRRPPKAKYSETGFTARSSSPSDSPKQRQQEQKKTLYWHYRSRTFIQILFGTSVIEINFFCIQNKVYKPYNFGLNRQDEVIISRKRVGHSKLLQGEWQPECIFCNCLLTIQHIFIECSDTFPARNLLFGNVQTMHDLFTMFDVNVLLQF